VQSPPENLFTRVADSLHEQVQLSWQHWLTACAEADIDAYQLDNFAEVGRLWACSDFVARNFIRYPEYAISIVTDLETGQSLADYDLALQRLLEQVDEQSSLRQVLRQFRNQQMLRIAMRDLTEHADIDALLQEQSDLAAAIIDRLAQYLHTQFCRDLGVPKNTDGEEQRLLVLAMGKLGGNELNFSSDIDLIFFYAEDGELEGKRSLSNHEYFLRLCREFVQTLDDVTADGFVFRVDTRLRPYGDSGPLAMSFAAMENYYQSQGRDWERYAMIKARVVSGKSQDAASFNQILQPFVYRRYLDFSVFAGIRDMKAMIEEQLRRKSLQGNIKLGKGGIREIEFIGQTFQLIRGGRDNRLQSRSIVTVLQTLAEIEVLSQQDVADLLSAYRYLRVVENRLQIQRDQQTHVLPADELARQSLLLAMRFDRWDSLQQEIDRHNEKVQAIFARLIAEQLPEQKSQSDSLKVAMQQFFDDADAQHLQSVLTLQNIELTAAEIKVLTQFVETAAVRNLSEKNRDRCVALLANLLTEIEDEHASTSLQYLLEIILAVIGRPVYLSMLLQYPLLRQRVIWLCQASHWFAEQIRHMPILLDELLEGDTQLSLPTHQQLAAQLDATISSVPGGDFELTLDSLRVFKQANQFNIAMLDVVAEHKVTDLADRLSDIAELLVEKTLQLAWDEIVARHGLPGCVVDGQEIKPGLAVIAYGKLGGAELGYGSDLDVVFIHNSRGERQTTDGERALDNRSFFSKVVQRFMHILGTRTFSGVLYEIDVRLRPDGRAGLMVTSTEAFELYQRERAWTWEHQALVRARFVAGDNKVAEEFDRIRRSVLMQQRDWRTLAKDVCEMRAKMREHLASKDSSRLDLKQGAGGLVDIEFIAQAGVLLLASQRAALLQSTSTLVLLSDLCAADWISDTDFERLYAAYVSLRRAANYQSLEVVNESLLRECEQHMLQISEIWQRLFAEFIE
jgi:glutamate-ammonia-ligase adenylyltransferase